MTLNPHAPICKPKRCSRLFAIYRPELLIEMDASISQDVADPVVPAICLKTSSDSNSPIFSEQLYLLNTQVDQLRITSEHALEQTNRLIQTFVLANIKQFQYLHAVHQQVAQFSVDLNTEKCERLKLCTTLRQSEGELIKLHWQVYEPSPSSLPVPFTVEPLRCVAFQDTCAIGNAQISKSPITITPKRALSTISKSRLPDQPPSLSTSRPSPLDLETRVKQLEGEITKAKSCREAIISIYRSQFTFLYDRFRALESWGRDIILWKLSPFRLVFDTAKPAARLDDTATKPSFHYKSPVNSTQPQGNNFFVHFYPCGLDSAAGNHTSVMFALFPGDYDGLLAWPFPKMIHPSVRDNMTPRKSGLSLSHHLRRYPFEGLRENHVLPRWTSTSSHTRRCSAKLKTFFWIKLYI